MKSYGMGILVGWALGLAAMNPAIASLPAGCAAGKDCLVNVEGSTCADGTQSFFQLTLRPNAKHLLVYVSGGGACWDKKTCESGYATSLTRKEKFENWNTGRGIHDSAGQKNPFGKDYNIVTIPYCTADVHAGNQNANYGTTEKPYIIRHQGYQNMVKTLDAVKELFPTPEKVVMLGCSAGGIGAFYHLGNLAKTYPAVRKYVISDAGTPFKPPYLIDTNYKSIMHRWGVDQTLPVNEAGEKVQHFGGVVNQNTVAFPDVHFGFISSYRDVVMTFFSLSVGSPSAQTAVKKNIIDVADNDIGRDAEFQKVFYTESSRHCHTGENLESINSLKNNLGDWITSMVDDQYATWDNSRPDLVRAVKSADDEPSDPKPKTIDDLKTLTRLK